MKIVDHILQDDAGNNQLIQNPSPNTSGALSDPPFLVVHYTAGGTLDGAVATLTEPDSSASAHLVIDRDGTITQLLRFDQIAWHAGRSRWHSFRGLNKHSIGIELVNAGPLTQRDTSWVSWFGKHYDETDVVQAAHRHGGEEEWWLAYPDVQITACMNACRALRKTYPIKDILGHDDIAPGRKLDPGPAFPMDRFCSSVFGREAEDREFYVTTARVNIRSGPGTDYEKVTSKPLDKDVKLEFFTRDASWCYVEVLSGEDEPPLESGWVHADYITPVWAV